MADLLPMDQRSDEQKLADLAAAPTEAVDLLVRIDQAQPPTSISITPAPGMVQEFQTPDASPAKRRELKREAKRRRKAGEDDRPWRHIYAHMLMTEGLALDTEAIAEPMPTDDLGDSALQVYKSGAKWGWRLLDEDGVQLARSDGAKWASALTATTAARAVFPDLEVTVV